MMYLSTRMSKFLFIIYDMSKEGGNSLQALNLAIQISLIGHEVIIITLNINNNQEKILNKTHIRVYTSFKKNNKKLNPLIKQLRLIKLINIVASKEEINLIQLFDPISTGLVSLYSLIRFRKPIVIRLGTIFEKFYAAKLKNILRISYKNISIKIFEKILRICCIFVLIKSKSVISNSSFINNHYKPYLNENKMHIIHNGVNIKKFSKNNNFLKHNDYALYVGRIEPRKSINIIIEAYSELSINTRPKKVYLIGDYNFDPDYTNILKILIKKLGLKEDITFKGFVPQNYLYKYYKNARYTIFSSNDKLFPMTEGLPNVVLEAMASGTIIVASDVAGVSEVIRNGENGFLYNSYSISELIKILSKLDEAPENYLNIIKNNAKIFIQNNLNFKIISRKYLEVYNNLIN